MDNNVFTSRDFLPEDCGRLPEILEKVWNVKSNEQYWKWRYLEAPFKTEAVVVVNGKGDIVGLNGYWLRPVKFGNEVITPYLSVDTMVLPEYRQSEASLIIVKHFRKIAQVHHSYGFPNAISHKFMHKFLNEFIGLDVSTPSLLALFNAGTVSGSPQPIQAVLNGISRSIHKIKYALGGSKGIEVTKDEQIDEEFNTLWDEINGDYYWIQKRDMDFLRWRYLMAPGSKYHIWKARENGKLVGYLVSTITVTSKSRKGQVVDWFVSLRRPDILSALLTAACRWNLAQGVDTMEAWFLSYPPQWEKVLKSHMFLIKRNPRMLLHTKEPKGQADSSPAPPRKPEDIMISVGDSDYLGWATVADYQEKNRLH